MDFTTKSDILVFYVNAIDSKSDDGSQIRGCSVHYLFWGDGTQLAPTSEPDITKPIGMMRGKSWIDYDLRNKIRIAPALYEGTFQMGVGSDGKPTLKLVDAAYKSNIRISAYRLRGLEVPGMLELPDDAYPPYGDAAPSDGAKGTASKAASK